MRIKIISAVFRKEVIDITRDRRALVISVLIPLMLFPASFFVMNLNLKKTAGSLESGIPSVLNIADQKIKQCITSGDRVKVVKSSNPADDLFRGKIAVVISEELNHGSKRKTVSILSDNTSQYSTAASEIIEGILKNCDQGSLINVDDRGDVSVIRNTLISAEEGAGIIMLQMLLPMLIFVFSATAPMAVAADLFAGEKERGTLEHLLSVPVTGGELLAGKYLAALCAGITGVISFMAGIALSYAVSPDVFGSAGVSLHISPAAAGLSLLFSIFIVMTLTSAEFVISIFAGSAREAQILFIPVIITAMACGETIAMIDVKRISILFRYIPMINSGLILKELMTGIFSWRFMAVAAIWSFTITIVFLYISRRMLEKEKYIFRK